MSLLGFELLCRTVRRKDLDKYLLQFMWRERGIKGQGLLSKDLRQVQGKTPMAGRTAHSTTGAFAVKLSLGPHKFLASTSASDFLTLE